MSGRSGSRPATAASLMGLSVCCFLLAGCFTWTGRSDRLARDLDRQLPLTHFERDGGVKLGRISLGLAKGVARWATSEEDRDEVEVFRGLKRLEFASYRAMAAGGQQGGQLPENLGLSLRGAGWETLARFRDEKAQGWIVYRMDEESLERLVVCVLDDEELTLIHLSGRLDRMIHAAIRLARSELNGTDPENNPASGDPDDNEIVEGARQTVPSQEPARVTDQVGGGDQTSGEGRGVG